MIKYKINSVATFNINSTQKVKNRTINLNPPPVNGEHMNINISTTRGQCSFSPPALCRSVVNVVSCYQIYSFKS